MNYPEKNLEVLKALQEDYRQAAERFYGANPDVRIRPYSAVQVFEDGAFIEATVWISKDFITKK